jgi:hypothetical protein
VGAINESDAASRLRRGVLEFNVKIEPTAQDGRAEKIDILW